MGFSGAMNICSPYSSLLEAERIVTSSIYGRVVFFGASEEESFVGKATSSSTFTAAIHCHDISIWIRVSVYLVLLSQSMGPGRSLGRLEVSTGTCYELLLITIFLLSSITFTMNLNPASVKRTNLTSYSRIFCYASKK